MKPVAIIPARGGSKRLPRKNILPFLGRPLIEWPISVAVESGLFSQIYVSTEDAEVASIAKLMGVEVIERPLELSLDSSTVVEVCIHALGVMAERGIKAESVCCIYATAALLSVGDLQSGLETLEASAFDSVMGVAEYDVSPFQALHEVDGVWEMRWPEYKGVQSQNYEELLCSCGMFYWIRTNALLAEKSFYTKRLGVCKVPRSRLCDINTKDDFLLAEARAKLLWGLSS